MIHQKPLFHLFTTIFFEKGCSLIRSRYKGWSGCGLKRILTKLILHWIPKKPVPVLNFLLHLERLDAVPVPILDFNSCFQEKVLPVLQFHFQFQSKECSLFPVLLLSHNLWQTLDKREKETSIYPVTCSKDIPTQRRTSFWDCFRHGKRSFCIWWEHLHLWYLQYHDNAKHMLVSWRGLWVCFKCQHLKKTKSRNFFSFSISRWSSISLHESQVLSQ